MDNNSEKLIELVYKTGLEVFNSLESLKEWLERPNIVLNGAIPENLISTQDGAQMVLDCLGRIQNGIYS